LQVYIKQIVHHGIAREFYYQLSLTLTLTLFIFLFLSVSVCLSLIIFLTFVSASQKNPAAPSLATECFAGAAPSLATSHLLYRLHQRFPTCGTRTTSGTQRCFIL
jgi:hypothetical protein